MQKKILIIDYGMGNLRSILKASQRIKAQVEVSNSIDKILKAKKLILPGVGHFKKGMENLHNSGLLDVLKKLIIHDRVPVLGICLGMQLLTKMSEEGDEKGLELIDAETIHFKNFNINTLSKIPHVGWNTIHSYNGNELLKGVNGEMMYFVHSYAVRCKNPDNVLCSSVYGGVEFHSGIRKDNVYGVQFHPEKSHKAGLNILENFVRL